MKIAITLDLTKAHLCEFKSADDSSFGLFTLLALVADSSDVAAQVIDSIFDDVRTQKGFVEVADMLSRIKASSSFRLPRGCLGRFCSCPAKTL